MYGLGVNTFRAWENLEAETGSLENRPLKRRAYKIDRGKLLEYYRDNPYSANKKTAIAFNCSVSGIHSAKKVLGITRKNTIQYAERDEQKREELIAEIEALPEDVELYHADESDFDEYYSREYGYAPRGEK